MIGMFEAADGGSGRLGGCTHTAPDAAKRQRCMQAVQLN